MRRRAALPLLLLAAAALAAAEVSPDQLNAYLGTVPVQNADEAAVASQLIRGFESVADEILTGRENPIVFSAAAPIDNTSAVNVSDVQAKVFATAIATWQMGVWNAPSNRGLRASKFFFYDRYHYYQIPKRPIGTLVLFHGCYHDASGNWPYDPIHCPECLGLPEEVAHVKIALKYGFAVLAVESRNRSQHGRCFDGGADPMTSDMWQAPYVIQNFLYEKGLQNLPIYTLGISAGAGFATKLPKAFYDTNFGGIIKLGGIISEVNAPGTWKSWGLIGTDGKFKYPDFPPVAFIMMERDDGPGSTDDLIRQRIADLRNYSVPADYLLVKPRRIGSFFFSDRSPTITIKQSFAIVKALQILGFIDKNGWLKDDPRIGQATRKSPLWKWNQRLVNKLPWLHMDIKKLSTNPMLSVLSDRSAIFEEMNVAWAMHEGIADYLAPCLFWLRSGGKLDLRWLASKLTVTRLSRLTADRVYPAPFPPMPPPPRPPPPSPRLQLPPSPVVRRPPPPTNRGMAGTATDRAPPPPVKRPSPPAGAKAADVVSSHAAVAAPSPPPAQG
ncbi:hypothetical protein ABPG77_007323 [Micractinium sp. CCAP 211/92]